MSDVLGFAYGLIVFAGGAIGYLKAGSVPSLLAGTIFGLLAAFSAYSHNTKLALITSLILLYVMGSRFYKGRKFMPAGLVTLLSIVMVIRYGIKLL